MQQIEPALVWLRFTKPALATEIDTSTSKAQQNTRGYIDSNNFNHVTFQIFLYKRGQNKPYSTVFHYRSFSCATWSLEKPAPEETPNPPPP